MEGAVVGGPLAEAPAAPAVREPDEELEARPRRAPRDADDLDDDRLRRRGEAELGIPAEPPLWGEAVALGLLDGGGGGLVLVVEFVVGGLVL